MLDAAAHKLQPVTAPPLLSLLPKKPADKSVQGMDAAQLAEAFALFARASDELSSAYNALQGQVSQLSDRLSVLMGALPAGVIVCDRDGRVVQMNRAALEMLGPSAQSLPWSEVASGLTPTETPGEVLVGRAHNTLRLSVSRAALESGDESIVLLHDITETHHMHQQAERQERLAAMGELVAGLAHQLRTPLSAAMLYTASLRQPALSAAERLSLSDRAIERLRHLERLIRDMLSFARGDSLGRQRFQVCELVRELAHTLEPIAKARKLSFTVHCDCDTFSLLADRKALAGALTNLLDNAFVAAGDGGRVSLGATHQQDRVHFRVADSGAGISPELQARLFEPFFTTRAEGTGLGLAIARGVARGHGGEISVISQPGQGAVFTLSLPASTQPLEASA